MASILEFLFDSVEIFIFLIAGVYAMWLRAMRSRAQPANRMPQAGGGAAGNAPDGTRAEPPVPDRDRERVATMRGSAIRDERRAPQLASDAAAVRGPLAEGARSAAGPADRDGPTVSAAAPKAGDSPPVGRRRDDVGPDHLDLDRLTAADAVKRFVWSEIFGPPRSKRRHHRL